MGYSCAGVGEGYRVAARKNKIGAGDAAGSHRDVEFMLFGTALIGIPYSKCPLAGVIGVGVGNGHGFSCVGGCSIRFYPGIVGEIAHGGAGAGIVVFQVEWSGAGYDRGGIEDPGRV